MHRHDLTHRVSGRRLYVDRLPLTKCLAVYDRQFSRPIYSSTAVPGEWPAQWMSIYWPACDSSVSVWVMVMSIASVRCCCSCCHASFWLLCLLKLPHHMYYVQLLISPWDRYFVQLRRYATSLRDEEFSESKHFLTLGHLAACNQIHQPLHNVSNFEI